MSKKRDEADRSAIECEPDPGALVVAEMDAAVSRWDPWLRALARMEGESEARVN